MTHPLHARSDRAMITIALIAAGTFLSAGLAFSQRGLAPLSEHTRLWAALGTTLVLSLILARHVYWWLRVRDVPPHVRALWDAGRIHVPARTIGVALLVAPAIPTLFPNSLVGLLLGLFVLNPRLMLVDSERKRALTTRLFGAKERSLTGMELKLTRRQGVWHVVGQGSQGHVSFGRAGGALDSIDLALAISAQTGLPIREITSPS